MSKSPEEIKQIVLKECKSLCPKNNDTCEIGDFMRMELEVTDSDNYMTWHLNVCQVRGYTFHIEINDSMKDWEADLAYRLLNLECKELQANSDLLTKDKDDLPEIVKYIKGDNLYSEDTVASIQERAKGLVDALEESKLALEHARETCQRPKRRYFSTALIKLGEALNQWKGQPAEAQK